jgi:hypothetical protein
MRLRTLATAAGVAALLAPASATADPVVRSAAGGNLADVQAVANTFRTDIGGGNTDGGNGSFGGVRREINWDGTPDGQSSPQSLSPIFFNSNSPRGVVFQTQPVGSHVRVSGDGVGSGAPLFEDVRAGYGTTFGASTPARIFGPVGTNVFDVVFHIPGTNDTATTSGFGAIFTDVDNAGSAKLDAYAADGSLLGSWNVANASGVATFSFLGVQFPAGEARIARVRITAGSAAMGANDDVSAGGPDDLVALDEFIYGEPLPRLAIDNPTVAVAENSGTATISVSRPTGAGVASVDFATANGTATAGSDFGAVTGRLDFGEGERTKTIAIPISTDAATEAPEAFTVRLSNAVGQAGLDRPSTATVSIADTTVPVVTPDTTASTNKIQSVKSSQKLATFLKGVKGRVTTNEPVRLDVSLLAKVKSGVRLAAAGDLELASKSYKLSGSARNISLKPSKRLIGRATKLTVRLKVVATDASGNRRTIFKTIRVKK